MLSVDDALEQILANFTALPAKNIDLASALGRVLAEDVRSDINLPPFANSSMDGYAVQAANIAHATPSITPFQRSPHIINRTSPPNARLTSTALNTDCGSVLAAPARNRCANGKPEMSVPLGGKTK